MNDPEEFALEAPDVVWSAGSFEGLLVHETFAEGELEVSRVGRRHTFYFRKRRL